METQKPRIAKTVFRKKSRAGSITKRQPTELEKIFVNDMTNKGFISKLYKQFVQLNIHI